MEKIEIKNIYLKDYGTKIPCVGCDVVTDKGDEFTLSREIRSGYDLHRVNAFLRKITRERVCISEFYDVLGYLRTLEDVKNDVRGRFFYPFEDKRGDFDGYRVERSEVLGWIIL